MSIVPRSRTSITGTPTTTGPASTTSNTPAATTRGGAAPRGTDTVERSRGNVEVGAAAAGGAQRGRAVGLRALVPVAPGVELTRDGLLVDGAATSRDGGVTRGSVGALYEAARRIQSADKNAFKALSGPQRERLKEHLELFLLSDRDGKTRDHSMGVKARAAGFALMHELFAAIPASDDKLRKEVAGLLVDAAAAEKHAGLRRHMALGVDGIPARVLTTAQVRSRDEAVTALAPPAPPYDKWFGNSAKPEFRVRQYAMAEFWRGEMAAYRDMGFTVKENGDRATATRMLEDPTGKNPPVKAVVELEKRDSEVFDAVADPKIHAVIYTGHSQLGAVGKISAASAPAMQGDKLIAMFACRTKQNLPTLRREFPGAHLLVSNHGTYAHDDRMVTSALFDGIARRSGYAQMEKAAEKMGPWEKNNYILPHDREQWHHADHDRDGALDAGGGRVDVLYNMDIESRARSSIDFKPRAFRGDVRTLDASRVTDAVSWFNTEHYYWAEDAGNTEDKRRADRFRAAGWFTSDRPDEIVRVTARGDGRDRSWEVSVNAAYSHLDADAVAMMVTHELARAVMKETRPNEDAHTQRMRALAMMGAYVNYHVEFSDTADNLLRNFAPRFGYPQTLTWPVVEKAIAADGHAEASEKVIRSFEKGMQYPFLEVNPAASSLRFRTEVQKALDVLRESRTPVARATFEAIVTGRVKVDTLSDLTRADFMRVRRDLAKDGVDIDVNAFLELHDEQSGAMRAITSTLDGYMWDDRVYIATGRKPEDLAATLVHEVNHVLNRSEENYRSALDTFREEYRAFYAEEWARTGKQPTRTRARALKQEVIDGYAIKGVTVNDVPDVPPGVLAPR